jgi:hypothetical protein
MEGLQLTSSVVTGFSEFEPFFTRKASPMNNNV